MAKRIRWVQYDVPLFVRVEIDDAYADEQEVTQVVLALDGTPDDLGRTDGPVMIPAGLKGPVDVALAKSAEQIPGPGDQVSGIRYEPKLLRGFCDLSVVRVGWAPGDLVTGRPKHGVSCRWPEGWWCDQ